MNNGPLFIVAGTYEQFREYCHYNRISHKDVRYIDTPIKLYGLRGLKCRMVGTWGERKNISEILDILKQREFTIEYEK